MAKRFPIDLAITVRHPAMIGTGPLGGYPGETGLAIASTDPLVAVTGHFAGGRTICRTE